MTDRAQAMSQPPWLTVIVTVIALVVAAQVALTAPGSVAAGVAALAGAVVILGTWHAYERTQEVADE
jgi:hypothetical protein